MCFPACFLAQLKLHNNNIRQETQPNDLVHVKFCALANNNKFRVDAPLFMLLNLKNKQTNKQINRLFLGPDGGSGGDVAAALGTSSKSAAADVGRVVVFLQGGGVVVTLLHFF